MTDISDEQVEAGARGAFEAETGSEWENQFAGVKQAWRHRSRNILTAALRPAEGDIALHLRNLEKVGGELDRRGLSNQAARIYSEVHHLRQAHAGGVVGDGWQLVPKEPSVDWLADYMLKMRLANKRNARLHIRAMLETAPTPGTPNDH